MAFCISHSCSWEQPGLAWSEGKWLYGSVSLWQVKLYPLPVALASSEGDITKHNTAFWFSTAFLLLLMYMCRNMTSFLSWQNERTGGGHSRSWLLTQPGLYCNIMFCRGLNFRSDAPSCVLLAGRLLPLLLPALWRETWNNTVVLDWAVSK